MFVYILDMLRLDFELRNMLPTESCVFQEAESFFFFSKSWTRIAFMSLWDQCPYLIENVSEMNLFSSFYISPISFILSSCHVFKVFYLSFTFFPKTRNLSLRLCSYLPALVFYEPAAWLAYCISLHSFQLFSDPDTSLFLGLHSHFAEAYPGSSLG